MSVHPLAGQPAPREMLVNIPRLVTAYFAHSPNVLDPSQAVSFGTSGHRGSSLRAGFNEAHILAVTQAVCDYRTAQGHAGPLFLGMDTHALSEPAFVTALEVLAANDVPVRYQAGLTATPTPVISHAVLLWNRDHPDHKADGIVITPSHNPPEDGGFKYNPPHGGPAGAEETAAIQNMANAYLEADNRGVRRLSYAKAKAAPSSTAYDFITPYVADLASVVDLDCVRDLKIKLGADPLGGSALTFWEPIAERYGLDLELVNNTLDPSFAFMPVDRDGVIRMDCSSPYAMAGLLAHKDAYAVAFGNDPDADRHGIVTPSGLMNPNDYLAVCVWYLFQYRSRWPREAKVGKTIVTSMLLDRVAAKLGREVAEVPVGFKWFVDGLLSGRYGFACEESAGASLLKKDGQVWTTDKDGIVMNLLAAEMTAITGKNPQELYDDLTREFGRPVYTRLSAPANLEQKQAFKKLTPEMVHTETLAGERIQSVITRAPEGGASIGGLKVSAPSGWFAARPSGTEDIYKIYVESMVGESHARLLAQEAQTLVDAAFKAAGV
ncbi:MAG: phosphoglucomutase (alpha-D-glucose-1,6-bisphosphate-dependent) [Desulfovibrio sp.]|nr:phosphoglucomutase (alpha-D-glucose-1,6-bisphosphate-dependent) [Desulfovibrio sp.]